MSMEQMINVKELTHEDGFIACGTTKDIRTGIYDAAFIKIISTRRTHHKSSEITERTERGRIGFAGLYKRS